MSSRTQLWPARESARRHAWVGSSLVLALVSILALVHGLAAQGTEPELKDRPGPGAGEPGWEIVTGSPEQLDLEGSNKMVDRPDGWPGDVLHFSIVISNSGAAILDPVWMTDALPAEMAYQSGTLAVAGGGLYGVGQNVITWTGAVSAGTQVQIGFHAMLTGSLIGGARLTNTAVISGAGLVLTRTASIGVITGSLAYLPLVSRYPSPPEIYPISYTAGTTSWTVLWADLGPQVIWYELRESTSPDFVTVTTYGPVSDTSVLISHDPLTSDQYYYQARVNLGGMLSGWSATEALLIPHPAPPALAPIPFPTSANQWTVSWNDAGTGVLHYQLQESQTADFASPVTYQITATSQAINHLLSVDNVYHYRVRVNRAGLISDWSNVESVVGGYRDDFDDPGTGWMIRREDTDDVNNSSWYDNGAFVLRIGGRWDYAIAAPMAQAPGSSYRISTRTYLWEPDNLHSYGIIFGGDWNGQPCPNDDFSSCFNHYYRLNIIYNGAPYEYKMQLKRIDYHDPVSNAGRGVPLTIPEFLVVSTPDSLGWNMWAVEVYNSGLIKVYLNGTQVAQATDSTYTNDRFFGVFASDDEYLGSRPYFDWYKVESLD